MQDSRLRIGNAPFQDEDYGRFENTRVPSACTVLLMPSLSALATAALRG